MSILTDNAREFARKVHTGHFRRDEKTPYFTHLEAVVDNLETLLVFRQSNYKINYDEMIAAAWLHDSVEDKKTNIDAIRSIFGEAVANHVLNLTHDKDELYVDYTERLALNPICRLIKIADILANLADSPTEKQLKKYTEALNIVVK